MILKIIHGPIAWGTSGHLLELQSIRPHPKFTELEIMAEAEQVGRIEGSANCPLCKDTHLSTIYREKKHLNKNQKSVSPLSTWF